jgi:outer membrane protein assembly factor BamB
MTDAIDRCRPRTRSAMLGAPLRPVPTLLLTLLFTVVLTLSLTVVASSFAGSQGGTEDWPQALGPNRNAVTATGVAPWPTAGPKIRWRRSVGEGFAGPAVVGDTLLLFHRLDDQEVVEALDTETGETRWATAYPTSYRDDFGFDEGPRATPAVAGGRVFTFGAQGVLQALRLDDGERLWSVDTHDRFGVRKGFFGAACAPLVHNGKVMLNVGGRDGAGIVAFEVETGELAWTATNDGASYAAPIIADIGNRQTALFFTRTGLAAIDPDSGVVRAQFRWRSRSGSSVNAATPVVVGNRIFISASYGTGAALLDFGERSFVPLWSSDDALTNHYATSVYADGYLYGYHGRQEYSPALRAVEAETGAVSWSEERFGGGTLILAGDNLLILRERGELLLAEATPEAFRPLARAQLLGGIVRAYPAFAGGVLYLRNERQLVAVELPG